MVPPVQHPTREGCMTAYNQHHPRGPAFALRSIVAGLVSEPN
jgi:hypothetical protein